MIGTQFTLYLEHKPGALAVVAKKLADARINIEGVSAAAMADSALVQVIVSDSKATARVLKKAKVAFTTQEVAVLTLKNRPGELARLSATLSRKGVNISYVYGTPCGDKCVLVVSAENLAKVERLWK